MRNMHGQRAGPEAGIGLGVGEGGGTPDQERKAFACGGGRKKHSPKASGGRRRDGIRSLGDGCCGRRCRDFRGMADDHHREEDPFRDHQEDRGPHHEIGRPRA